eukprot:1136764-Pelagomonas_calceolata.AAC.14
MSSCPAIMQRRAFVLSVVHKHQYVHAQRPSLTPSPPSSSSSSSSPSTSLASNHSDKGRSSHLFETCGHEALF